MFSFVIFHPFGFLNKNLSWVSAITFQPAAAVQKRLEIVIQIQTKGLLPPPFCYSLQSATASVSYALGLDWSFQTICKSNCIPRIIYEIIINENLTGWEKNHEKRIKERVLRQFRFSDTQYWWVIRGSWLQCVVIKLLESTLVVNWFVSVILTRKLTSHLFSDSPATQNALFFHRHKWPQT